MQMSVLDINDEDHLCKMYLRTCRRYRITTSLTYISHQFNPLAFVLLFFNATGGLDRAASNFGVLDLWWGPPQTTLSVQTRHLRLENLLGLELGRSRETLGSQ